VSGRGPRLAVVLATTAGTLAVGWLLKAPCLGSWADGRQYNRLCYSDVAALYASDDRDRGLDERRFPYVDGQNEYPVLTGVAMWVTALPASSYPTYFVWTSLLLTGAALGTAAALHRVAPRHALMFAAAPTLLIYAFVNWDLVAVVLATLATIAYLRERDAASGMLLGLGAAAKLYPALLVIPFALGRLRQDRRDAARRIVLWSAGAWLLLNVPFALASFERWSEFFRFNSQRPADWDSLWFLAAGRLGFTWNIPVLNALVAVAFLALAIGLWRAKERRDPGFPAWTFGFPLLVAFLITGKVYSPQYGLWLLPLFALALPHWRLFALFSIADVAVFVTRFQYFARFEELGDGLPFWAFELAVLFRTGVLVACLVAWVRRREPGPEEEARAPALEAA
jgi:uncharacterized membrane protein